eukprot:6210230-Pleurochrysis_carterae.AAC.1
MLGAALTKCCSPDARAQSDALRPISAFLEVALRRLKPLERWLCCDKMPFEGGRTQKEDKVGRGRSATRSSTSLKKRRLKLPTRTRTNSSKGEHVGISEEERAGGECKSESKRERRREGARKRVGEKNERALVREEREGKNESN